MYIWTFQFLYLVKHNQLKVYHQLYTIAFTNINFKFDNDPLC